MSPRPKALYLVALAIGVFFVPSWPLLGLIAAVQAGLWLGLGLGPRRLARQLSKLALFLSVIIVAYAFTGLDQGGDDWRQLSVLGWAIEVNLSGLRAGLSMALRVIAVVLASQVVRAGDPRALATGLGQLGVPRSASLAIDTVLVLLGDASGGRGRGGGGGGGGGRGGGGGGGGGRGRGRSWRGFWSGLRRLARGDVSLLVERMHQQVARAQQHISTSAALGPASAASEPARSQSQEPGPDGEVRALGADIAVIAGVALTMLSIKALKLLPGIPFAPGHKGVILIPLYIAAGLLTRGRAGATITGLTMGTVAFLLGDGRYGVFEIAKHVAPGVIVDLLVPLVRGRERSLRLWAWSLLGLAVALGRYATVTVIALAVQAPAVVYAVLLPGLLVHAVFGVLSGLVSAPLVRAMRARSASDEPAPSDARTPGSGRGGGSGRGDGSGRGGGSGRGDGSGRGGGSGRGDGSGRGGGSGRGDGSGRGGGSGRGSGSRRGDGSGRGDRAGRGDEHGHGGSGAHERERMSR